MRIHAVFNCIILYYKSNKSYFIIAYIIKLFKKSKKSFGDMVPSGEGFLKFVTSKDSEKMDERISHVQWGLLPAFLSDIGSIFHVITTVHILWFCALW